MNQYIVNLTGHLIGKRSYDAMFHHFDHEAFIKAVKIDLMANEVRIMSPAKIGQIMCAFEIGDVMAGKGDLVKGLFKDVTFNGDCEEMLRELVSLCLAYAIKERLEETPAPNVPTWQGRVPGFQPSFQAVVDGLSPEQAFRDKINEVFQSGSEADLEVLLTEGMDVNQTDSQGRNALQLFSFRGNKGGVEMLLARKPDVNAICMYHGRIPQTALDAAEEGKQTEIAEILKAHGAKKGKELVPASK